MRCSWFPVDHTAEDNYIQQAEEKKETDIFLYYIIQLN